MIQFENVKDLLETAQKIEIGAAERYMEYAETASKVNPETAALFKRLAEEELELAQDAMTKLAGKHMIEIEGIGPAYSEKLSAIEIETIDQYLLAAADRKGRKDLADQTGISSKLILEWANRADLMRVSGIGEEFSDLLAQAGVDTVNELKFRNPEHLYNSLLEINEEKSLVRRVPSQDDVFAWVASAQQLPVMLTY